MFQSMDSVIIHIAEVQVNNFHLISLIVVLLKVMVHDQYGSRSMMISNKY